jgi:hypothetical protein
LPTQNFPRALCRRLPLAKPLPRVFGKDSASSSVYRVCLVTCIRA